MWKHSVHLSAASIRTHLAIRRLSSCFKKRYCHLIPAKSTSCFAQRFFSMANQCSIQSSSKILVAFDFDHTIIDQNSDLHVVDLAPKGKIPPEVKALYTSNNWTVYMGEIFKYLYKCGITKEKMLSYVSAMEFAPGMVDLINFLRDNKSNFDNIVISDSNSVFIDCILQATKFDDVFSEIHTNPAKFDSEGLLGIEYYHTQDWCDMSTVNLCKGHILETYIAKQKKKGNEYKTIVYVGDGKNDLCPATRLSENDWVFARKDYKFHKTILDKSERAKVKANLVIYANALEILEELKPVLGDLVKR